MSIDEKALQHTKDTLPWPPEMIGNAIHTYEAAKVAHQPVGCREAFEKYHAQQFGWELTRPEHYKDVRVKERWETWQAAWQPVRESGKSTEMIHATLLARAIRMLGVSTKTGKRRRWVPVADVLWLIENNAKSGSTEENARRG